MKEGVYFIDIHDRLNEEFNNVALGL
jgi:hypothetical protein